jgi:hypothetical protein
MPLPNNTDLWQSRHHSTISSRNVSFDIDKK